MDLYSKICVLFRKSSISTFTPYKFIITQINGYDIFITHEIYI